MIELENIKKHYTLNGKDVPILKGIHLFVGQGEFVSIMGPSGSGKSTLSAILGCLSTPTSGTYKINGQNVTELGPDKIARLRNSSIGFIFQDFNLLSGLTALENVALPLVYGGMNARDRKERAMECLTKVGLGHKAHNRPNQLSGGQKQRVAIARALVNEPRFLFADEPTGALDKKTGHEILSMMQRLNMQGHTVIQVTHSPQDAAYSKRILHLVDGNIVRDETVEKPTIGAASATGEDSADSEMTSKLWRIAQLSPSPSAKDLPAIAQLVASSKTRDSHIAAARAIVRWGKFEVEHIIEQLFSSEDWVVRAEIVKYSNLRPRELALPYYIRALGDENAWVRHTAIVELKDIEQSELSPQDQETILKCLLDTDERVRSATIHIIRNWQLPQIQDLLAAGLRDLDSRVRANTIEAITSDELKRSLLPALTILTNDRNNRVRANAIRIVAEFEPAIAENNVQEMLRSPDSLTRSSGAWLVGVLKLKSGGIILQDLLRAEKEEIVINQVVRSLSKLTRDLYPLDTLIADTLDQSRIT